MDIESEARGVGSPKDIDARKYSKAAKQRLEEAKLILEKVQLYAAAEYLAGYSVECILKALVLTLTPRSMRPEPGAATVEWLKNEFGHDLGKLRRRAAGRGATMPKDVASKFERVSHWDPQARYEPGPGDPRRAERFVAAAEAILLWADRSM